MEDWGEVLLSWPPPEQGSPGPPLLYWAGVVGALLVLALVLPIMVAADSTKTIDCMIRLDCLLRLANLPIILFVSGVINRTAFLKTDTFFFFYILM